MKKCITLIIIAVCTQLLLSAVITASATDYNTNIILIIEETEPVTEITTQTAIENEKTLSTTTTEVKNNLNTYSNINKIKTIVPTGYDFKVFIFMLLFLITTIAVILKLRSCKQWKN